jgi:hypothetical protein
MMSVAFHQKLPSNKTEGFNVPKTITAFFFLKKIKEQLMLQMEATVYRLPMAQFWGEMEKKYTDRRSKRIGTEPPDRKER